MATQPETLDDDLIHATGLGFTGLLFMDTDEHKT